MFARAFGDRDDVSIWMVTHLRIGLMVWHDGYQEIGTVTEVRPNGLLVVTSDGEEDYFARSQTHVPARGSVLDVVANTIRDPYYSIREQLRIALVAVQNAGVAFENAGVGRKMDSDEEAIADELHDAISNVAMKLADNLSNLFCQQRAEREKAGGK